jgi:hypothetical protein
MVTVVLLATAWPKSWNVALLEPTGTDCGENTPTTDGALLLKDTGASNGPVTMPVMVIVALALLPAAIEFGLIMKDFRVAPPGGSTSSWPNTWAVPRVAATVIGHWTEVAEVITEKEALVAPAGTVMSAGT